MSGSWYKLKILRPTRILLSLHWTSVHFLYTFTSCCQWKMAPSCAVSRVIIAALFGPALCTFSVVDPGTIANTSTTTLAPSCVDAVESEVVCDAYLQLQASADTYGADNYTQAYVCTSTCASSLTSYISNVESTCAGQPLPWDDMPHAYFGKVLQATYNMSCLQDATGQYCSREFQQRPATVDAPFF